MLPPPRLSVRRLIAFVGKEVSQRRPAGRSGTGPSRGRRRLRKSFSSSSAKEALSEIARFVGTGALMADVGVEGLPVGLAEAFQSRPSLRFGTVSGSENLTPLRRGYLAAHALVLKERLEQRIAQSHIARLADRSGCSFRLSHPTERGPRNAPPGGVGVLPLFCVSPPKATHWARPSACPGECRCCWDRSART